MSGQLPDFSGVTGNEKIAADWVGQFDAALMQRAIELLEQVAMTERSAGSTVDVIMQNPSQYGYQRPS